MNAESPLLFSVYYFLLSCLVILVNSSNLIWISRGDILLLEGEGMEEEAVVMVVNFLPLMVDGGERRKEGRKEVIQPKKR